MTNFECDKIFEKTLDDVFKNDANKNDIINNLNKSLDIDQKLLLLRYYLEYKYKAKSKSEINYKKEELLQGILDHVISFIVTDIIDGVSSFQSEMDIIVLKPLISEIYNLFKLGKEKFGKIKITMSKLAYDITLNFLKDFLKMSNFQKEK